MTPACLHELYNVPLADEEVTLEPSAVRFGIGGYLHQFSHYRNATAFLEKHRAANYHFSVALVHNGTNLQSPPTNASIEASLDVQEGSAIRTRLLQVDESA